MANKVETVKLPSNLPKRFNVESDELCAKDIVAYVRGQVVPDIWTPVVLDSMLRPLAVNELEESGIFWKGLNEDKASSMVGVSVHSYCVVDVKSLDSSLPDCGLMAILHDFWTSNNIARCDVLIVGDNDGSSGPVNTLLRKLKDYVLTNNVEGVFFPGFVIKQNKLLPYGLDISEYAQKIEWYRGRNSLDSKVLSEILQAVDGEIDPERTVIQDLREMRTTDVKMLTTYFVMKHGLPPAYVTTFISEYVKFQFLYPFRKLSLYERMAFIHSVPRLVGYIGNTISFYCLAQVHKRVYPHPHYVFDMQTNRLVENVEDFYIDVADKSVKFYDFRRWFIESRDYFSSDSGVRKPTGEIDVVRDKRAPSRDEEVDRKISSMFAEYSKLVTDEQVYLSVKNTVIMERDKKRYLLYCPEEGAIMVMLMSEYTGMFPLVIPETEFCKLIDAQMCSALLNRDRASTASAGREEMVVRWRKADPSKAIKPAVPLEVTLYGTLLDTYQNGFSYFDRCLRCQPDVLPIVTSHDSPSRDVNPIFDYFDFADLRRDPQAGSVINCFGTISNFSKRRPELPITFQVFNHRGLL